MAGQPKLGRDIGGASLEEKELDGGNAMEELNKLIRQRGR